MAKRSGILEKLKKPKTQTPVPTRRIAVPGQDGGMRPGAPNAAAGSAEYLEDTPVVLGGSFDDAETEPRVKPDKRSRQVTGSLNISKRYRVKKKTFRPGAVLNTVFGGRTKESAALDFAMNHRRVSKRQRKRRLLLTYIAAGVAVAAVLLVVVFVPGGIAASKDQHPQGGDTLAAAANIVGTKSAASMPAASATGTDQPDVTANGLAAGDEPSITASESPTEAPTEAPTVEPTEDSTPIPTTNPDPTPPPVTLESCVDDFVVNADKYYKYSTNHYDYTEDDVYMLAQIITSEARGESRNGMVAVGNVVMNRVLNRHKFGNTIKDVITAAGQFAYNASVKPTSSAKKAARMVLQDEVWVIAQDVYYFRSGVSSGVDWGSHKFYTKIGGHCFYSHSYSGRQRGGDPPPKLFDRTYKYAQYGCKPEKRVYRLQYMLNKLGYDVKADRYYGQDTVDALKEFQAKYGLGADGIAGPATVTKLIETFGLNNYYRQFLAG